MFTSQTKIFGKSQLDQNKKELLNQLINEFHISPTGVAMVLDNDGYQDFENDVWRAQGIHMNLKEGFEWWSPPLLYEIMDSGKYSNLIWISKRICIGDIMDFVWVVSHELQHYVQDSISNTISVSNNFLREFFIESPLIIDEPRESVSIPYDFDAELAARKMVIKVFGNKKATDYIEDPLKRGRLARIGSFDLSRDYNVVSETIFLLKKYRPQLIEFQQVFQDQFQNGFEIDKAIDELSRCSEPNQYMSI